MTTTTRSDSASGFKPVWHLLSRPGVHVGVMLGVAGFLDLRPFQPGSPMTWILFLLPVLYLGFGVVRGGMRGRRAVLRQLIGLAVFGGLALGGYLVEPWLGQFLVAAGWLGHAAWDLAHRDGKVVPRWFVDFCVPADLLIGLSLLAAAFL